MTPGFGFVLFLVVTLALLGCTVLTGLAARRKVHIPLAVSSLLALLITIYYAEKLGEQYDVETAGMITPIHLTLAKITTALYALPVITGIMTIRKAQHLRWHRKIAFGVLGMTVITAGTGVAMILLSDPVAG